MPEAWWLVVAVVAVGFIPAAVFALLIRRLGRGPRAAPTLRGTPRRDTEAAGALAQAEARERVARIFADALIQAQEVFTGSTASVDTRTLQQTATMLQSLVSDLRAAIDAFRREQQQFGSQLGVEIQALHSSIQSLDAAIRSLQEALGTLPSTQRDKVTARPFRLADREATQAAVAGFSPERPVTVSVTGARSFDQLVELERCLGSVEGVHSVRLESYEQGKASFVLLLSHQLSTGSLEQSLRAQLHDAVAIESADPRLAEVKLLLRTRR